MPKTIDMIGIQYGKWMVLTGPYRVNKQTKWECMCQCGAIHDVNGPSLRRGTSTQCQSCASTKHGLAGNFQQGNTSPEYNAWHSAKSRCTNPNNPKFDDYGHRGIAMCPEWLNSFQAFYDHIGPRPVGLVLDRIDNDGNYEPGNVRWATYSQSNLNRRTK